MGKNPFDQFPHIVTEELTLRKLADSDIDDIYEIYSNENLFQHSPLAMEKNKDAVPDMLERFQKNFLEGRHMSLGICLNSDPSRIVGVAEIFSYSPKENMITVGYRLNDRFWGQGIATKTVKAMVDYLFQDMGINRIQAFVMPENTKSHNVLLRNGFTKEGVIRQGQVWKGLGLVDLALYSLLRSDL